MAALTQIWLLVSLCFLFLVKPITLLWRKKADVDTSRINHSDLHITTEFSDGKQSIEHLMYSALAKFYYDVRFNTSLVSYLFLEVH